MLNLIGFIVVIFVLVCALTVLIYGIGYVIGRGMMAGFKDAVEIKIAAVKEDPAKEDEP